MMWIRDCVVLCLVLLCCVQRVSCASSQRQRFISQSRVQTRVGVSSNIPHHWSWRDRVGVLPWWYRASENRAVCVCSAVIRSVCGSWKITGLRLYKRGAGESILMVKTHSNKTETPLKHLLSVHTFHRCPLKNIGYLNSVFQEMGKNSLLLFN